MSTPKFNPIQILKKAGVTIRTCFPVADCLFRGEFTAVKVRGFDYKKDYGYPWDNIPWFKTGTGSGDGNGNWTGGYEIDIRKTPPAFMKRVLRAVTKLKDAKDKHQDATHKCSHIADSARQRAWTKASRKLDLMDLQYSVMKARKDFVAFLIQGKTDEP